MKITRISLLVAAACALAIVSLLDNAAQQPSASPPTKFEQAYVTTINSVRTQYVGTDLDPTDWERLQNRYGSRIGNFEELEKAIADTLSHADDSRFKLLSTKERDELEALKRSSYIGIGLSYFKPASLTGAVVVKSVFEESKGEAAGLKAGDKITAVDGKSVNTRQFDDILNNMITGYPGTIVTLTVQREGQLMSIPVERDLDRRLGIEVGSADEVKGFKVETLSRDGPAQKAGLMEGDIIITIDQKSTYGMTEDDASNALRIGSPGSKVVVSVVRNRETRLITITRDFVENSNSTIDVRGESASWKPGFNHLRLFNLDWKELPKRFASYPAVFEDSNNAVILDLRSTTGNDPDAAAKIASWFMDSGVVLRYETGTGLGTVTTKYEIKSGEIVKTFSGAKKGTETIALPYEQRRFTKDLVVLVDKNTAGTAEALALTLQVSGRATVTGIATSGRPSLTTTWSLTLEDGRLITVQIPSSTLVKANGGTITGVTPDKSVFFESDILDTAKSQIDGETWRVRTATTVVVSVIAGVLVLVFFLVVSRIGGKGSDDRVESEAVATEEETVASDDETKASTEAAKPEPRWLNVLCIILCLSMFAALFGTKYAIDYANRAPAGYTSEILVTVMVDDHDLSKLQRKVVEQSASEYSGAIKFKIIDAKVTPELAVSKWGPVTAFPSIGFTKIEHDGSGKETVEGGGLANALYTKRQMIENIESLAKSRQSFWPNTPIKRVRPAKP